MSVVGVAPHFEVLRLRIMLFLVPTFFWSSRYVLYTTTFGPVWRQGTLGGCNVLSSHRSSWCWAVCPIHDSTGGRGWLASLSGLDHCFYKPYPYAAGRLTKQAGQDIQFRCTDVFLHQLHACILLVVTAMARVSATDLPGQSSSFSAYPFFACLRLFLVVAGQQHSSPAVEWIDALVLSQKSLKFYLHELHTGNRFCWQAKPRERAMLILHRWTYERQGVTGLGRG